MHGVVGRPWRHRRVWLLASLQPAELAATDPRAVEPLRAWVAQGRAVVGRARLPGDAPDRLPLGLAQRIDGAKLRWSFSLAPAAVVRVEEPLTLAEVVPGLPASMRAAAQRLVDEAAALGMPLRVYGSAFWQHAAAGGAGYLHDNSDLDLLCQPGTAKHARRWLAVLERLQAGSPMRLDGEIELPGGEAVAWRELAGTSGSLLVKSDKGPSLRSREQVWRSWPQPELTRC